jgi:ABC-type uncharacterized transport system involved in gliding motility auxiliary subunit
MIRNSSATALHVGHLLLQVVIVATTLAFLLLLAERHNRRFDFSPEQRYVLSEAARKVAEQIDRPALITAFYTPDEPGQRRAVLDTLELFSRANPLIRYRLVDLNRSPALAQAYGINNAGSGVMEMDGRREAIRYIDEEGISTAILRLTRQSERKVCFITGHGEHSPYDNDDRRGYSEVGKALEREMFTIHQVEFIAENQLAAAGCRVVVLAGPNRDFLPGELAALSKFLESGGQVLLLVDPDAPADLVRWLLEHGVRAGQDVVLDERNRLVGMDPSVLTVPAFNKSVFRTDLEPAVFPVARTVVPTEEGDRSGRVQVLALSSPESWAYIEGGRLPDREVRFRRGKDQPGPLPVGVQVEFPVAGHNSEAPGRLIVFGDSDFATNLSLNWRGNKDLFLSSVGLLAEDPALVAVRRKGLPKGSVSPIYLTEGQDAVVFWVAVVLVPSVVVVAGIFIATHRRRKGSR